MVNATPPFDPVVVWTGLAITLITGISGAVAAYMKRNDPLVPPPAPVVISTPTPATSTDSAVVATQAANAKLLEMVERHTQKADEHVALYARENGDLRKQNGELLERIAELQRQLMRSENQVVALTTKVDVLQSRLDERERRG